MGRKKNKRIDDLVNILLDTERLYFIDHHRHQCIPQGMKMPKQDTERHMKGCAIPCSDVEVRFCEQMAIANYNFPPF